MARRRIMDQALQEFSAHGYGGSSINTICAGEGISKGVVYHYFGSKDELFLACVRECFDSLTAYIRENFHPEGTVDQQLTAYFRVRSDFFAEHPFFQRIFCDAVITPPEHLRPQILECRQEFNELNEQIFRNMLAGTELRPGLDRKEVIQNFSQYQDFINVRYQMNKDADAFRSREEECRKAMDILLYGIVQKR